VIRQNRTSRVLYVLFFAFVMSEGVFCLLAATMPQSPQHVARPVDTIASMRPLIYGFAALTLLASLAWTFVATRLSSSSMQFQRNVILSLALSEACTIAELFYLFTILPQIARRR